MQLQGATYEYNTGEVLEITRQLLRLSVYPAFYFYNVKGLSVMSYDS
jgi:hypothetical protein